MEKGWQNCHPLSRARPATTQPPRSTPAHATNPHTPTGAARACPLSRRPQKLLPRPATGRPVRRPVTAITAPGRYAPVRRRRGASSGGRRRVASDFSASPSPRSWWPLRPDGRPSMLRSGGSSEGQGRRPAKPGGAAPTAPLSLLRSRRFPYVVGYSEKKRRDYNGLRRKCHPPFCRVVTPLFAGLSPPFLQLTFSAFSAAPRRLE